MANRLTDFVEFNDAGLESKYGKKRIPISALIEHYFDGTIDLKGDALEFLEERDLFVRYSLTPDHFKFLFTRFLPEVAIHSKKQDTRIVRDHYDRGNDFFNWFLGETMVYTSGFFQTGKETLEEAQQQKMELVCQKLQLEEGESHLDIGCGWGTLARWAAANHGVDSTGVTIAERQTEYGNAQIEAKALTDKARILCLDYRDIPKRRWDKISCLEMAEHVGVKNFQKFINQCYRMLNEDGIFYLQIAGLRAGLHFEDLMWGLFMNKYIFSGADASLPLSNVVRALEKAGFEIHSVENVGIHYSLTIRRWYDNWLENKEKVLNKYGQRWYRIWEIFLAWSVIIARQGSSTCFQIVANKNLDHFDRTRWFNQPTLGEREPIFAAAGPAAAASAGNGATPPAQAPA